MPEPTETTELHDDAPLDQVRAAYNRERERRTSAEQEAQRAATLARENAFLRAGVDDSSPIGQLFTRGYDGELDVEAIKAAWTQVAPQPTTPPPTPDPTPPVGDGTQPNPASQGMTDEELERLRNSRQGLTSGSEPPGSEPEGEMGQAVMDAAFGAQGGTRARPTTGFSDKALNAGFSEIFGRAVKDDPQAIFKRPHESWADATDRWRESQA